MKFTLIVDKDKEEELVLTAHRPSDFTAQVEALVLQYNGTDKLVAFDEDDCCMLPIDQIECITVLNGKTCAITTDGSQLRLKQRLYELEPLLPKNFIRINKSTLANETKIQRFRAVYTGAVDAIFQCGYTDYVSRRCFAQIKRRFEQK